MTLYAVAPRLQNAGFCLVQNLASRNRMRFQLAQVLESHVLCMLHAGA